MIELPDVVARIRSEWTFAVDTGKESGADAGQVAIKNLVIACDTNVIRPIEFAEAAWWLALRVPEFEPVLRSLIGMASDWQDDTEHRAEYDDDIRLAAAALQLPL